MSKIDSADHGLEDLSIEDLKELEASMKGL